VCRFLDACYVLYWLGLVGWIVGKLSSFAHNCLTVVYRNTSNWPCLVISVPVCMFAYIFKKHIQNKINKNFCVCYRRPWICPALMTLQYIIRIRLKTIMFMAMVDYGCTYVHIWMSLQLDGKYSERGKLPTKAKFGVFVANAWQHLPHLLFCVPLVLNFPTERYCRQSPVYGVFWLLLPHPPTDRNETRTWSSISP